MDLKPTLKVDDEELFENPEKPEAGLAEAAVEKADLPAGTLKAEPPNPPVGAVAPEAKGEAVLPPEDANGELCEGAKADFPKPEPAEPKAGWPNAELPPEGWAKALFPKPAAPKADCVVVVLKAVLGLSVVAGARENDFSTSVRIIH